MGNNNVGLKYNLLKHTAHPFLLNSIFVIDYIERHLTNPLKDNYIHYSFSRGSIMEYQLTPLKKNLLFLMRRPCQSSPIFRERPLGRKL
jgi:hypothetical protein